MSDSIPYTADNLTQQQMLALVLWENRHKNPSFALQIHDKDVAAFNQCCDYLHVEPKITCHRPFGTLAHPGSPATERRGAIAAREASDPRPYVVVAMVDQDGNTFVPIENNEADQDKAKQEARRRELPEKARWVAQQLQADLQSGTNSQATVQAAIQILQQVGAG